MRRGLPSAPRSPSLAAVVETMAELVAAAVPELLRPEQAAQHYAEAVQTAVAACAEDTAGQRCYICLEAVHPDTNEGLVRGCACRGGAGFAHVSCLARGAQVAVERDVQNRWKRWHTCGLCEQKYHGVVAVRARVGVLEDVRGSAGGGLGSDDAMNQLGNGLSDARHHEDALSVREAELSMLRRLGASEATCSSCRTILRARMNRLDGMKRPDRCKRRILRTFEALWRRT